MLARSFALAAIAVVGHCLAHEATAQTVISSLPYTISTPGKYVLTSHLTAASAGPVAITINAANVTLDLNDYSVSAPAGSTASATAVIQVGNVANVTIRNGAIANNGYGIYFLGGANTRNHLVENVSITKCNLAGIAFLAASPGSVLRNNSISFTGGYTGTPNSYAYGILSFGGVSIENNHIATATPTGTGLSFGIYAGSTDFAAGNKISSCGTGIAMASGGKFLNNLTANCPTAFSGGTNATGNN